MPYIKKFREDRELNILLAVDVSASSWFGSVDQSKRDLARGGRGAARDDRDAQPRPRRTPPIRGGPSGVDALAPRTRPSPASDPRARCSRSRGESDRDDRRRAFSRTSPRSAASFPHLRLPGRRLVDDPRCAMLGRKHDVIALVLTTRASSSCRTSVSSRLRTRDRQHRSHRHGDRRLREEYASTRRQPAHRAPSGTRADEDRQRRPLHGPSLRSRADGAVQRADETRLRKLFAALALAFPLAFAGVAAPRIPVNAAATLDRRPSRSATAALPHRLRRRRGGVLGRGPEDRAHRRRPRGARGPAVRPLDAPRGIARWTFRYRDHRLGRRRSRRAADRGPVQRAERRERCRDDRAAASFRWRPSSRREQHVGDQAAEAAARSA